MPPTSTAPPFSTAPTTSRRCRRTRSIPRSGWNRTAWAISRKPITQAKLDEQRGVVQNEKRQRDNQPYGKVFEEILQQLFPPEHPYSWETIGSMADLNAASLDDVREWFETYYGPNNAVVVDRRRRDGRGRLRQRREVLRRHSAGTAARAASRNGFRPTTSVRRQNHAGPRVRNPACTCAWTGPRWGTTDAHHLALASAILAGGKNSRLYERLVYRDQTGLRRGVRVARPRDRRHHLPGGVGPAGRVAGTTGSRRQRGAGTLSQVRSDGEGTRAGEDPAACWFRPRPGEGWRLLRQIGGPGREHGVWRLPGRLETGLSGCGSCHPGGTAGSGQQVGQPHPLRADRRAGQRSWRPRPPARTAARCPKRPAKCR